MVGRGCLVLAVLCGCAQLRPVAGYESRPALASSLAGWNGGYEQRPGGWDVRMGLVVPYETKYLSPGPRFDVIGTKYFKAESFSVEVGLGAYIMFDSRWEKENDYQVGQIYVIPMTCVAKYFFELIYKSGFKVYAGIGVGLYWAGTLSEPAVQIDDSSLGMGIPLALSVPFCFGVQLAREERTAIEVEIRFDGVIGPEFDAVAEYPATIVRTEGEAGLGVMFISVNWKGVF